MTRLDELLDPLREERMRFDLGPMRSLLARLGHPERGLAVVLVAGTNGKGTVAAMLSAILTASGSRVGLYTSPHLEEARERIRLDGIALSERDLEDLLEEVLAAGSDPPTYFEALTAVALLAFRRADVDAAVLEVGLGGRLDATNSTRPVLSVVTSIDLDHQSLLGSTLDAIAREKAGIFRAGVPALIGEERDPAGGVLRQVAGEVGAELVPFRWSGSQALDRVRMGALAQQAAALLLSAGGTTLDPGVAARALRDLWWPGRDERLSLPEGRGVWLDCAHNPAAAARLAERVRSDAEPWSLLFGCLADKDHRGMLQALLPTVRRLFVVEPEDTERARSREDLEVLLRASWPGASFRSGSISAMLDSALERERRVVVTGSFRVVGPARRHLRLRFGVPPPASAPLFPMEASDQTG